MSDTYYTNKRAIADNEAQLDLEKPVHQLLADVHDESIDNRQPDAQRLGRVLARFASLLSVLSAQADKQAAENFKVQHTLNIFTKWLIGLTIALLLLGVIQTGFTIGSFILSYKVLQTSTSPQNTKKP